MTVDVELVTRNHGGNHGGNHGFSIRNGAKARF